MKKIKVLQMPIRNAKGGITQYALRNWDYIDKTRFSFDWATLDAKLSFEDELIQQGCKVHHISCRQETDEAHFRREMADIFSVGYDVIHLHTSFWRGFLAEELAIKAGIPRIIVHAHSTGIDHADPNEREMLINAHEKWKSQFNTKLATHFAACSTLAADFLYSPKIPKEQIIILKNAIDTDKFAYNQKTREQLRYNMGLDGKFVLLMVARLEYQKNHSFALKVFADVVKATPNAVLLLAGDGKLRDSLEKEAAELGITQSIRFLGFRDDVQVLLQGADLMLVPSLFEGFSISTIEAQCTGIYCCCSCHIPDEAIILDSAVRLPLDVKLWRDTIVNIARTGYVRRNRSKEVVAAGFSLKKQIKLLEGMYL